MNKDTIRIANCSGYYGDKLSAAKELVDGAPSTIKEAAPKDEAETIKTKQNLVAQLNLFRQQDHSRW